MRGRGMFKRGMVLFAAFFMTVLFAGISPAWAIVVGSTITVNTLGDVVANDGACSLREAITNANANGQLYVAFGECAAGTGADTINFSASVVPGTIILNSTLPTISSQSLTINGPGAGSLTISGAGTHMVMFINPGIALNVQDLTIANGAAWAGGGIYNNGGTLNVTNSTFSGNSAQQYGGGIYNYVGTLNVTNSTFSGNSAFFGGGIYNVYRTANITNSTFSGNSAADIYGGGILNTGGGTLTLQNSIVANSPTGGDCYIFGAITSNGYNLSTDNTCNLTQPTDMPNTDPLLDILADNGGPTDTMALDSGSPAIDAIPYGTNGCGTTITTDQRGVSRPSPSGGKCDIGAFEVEPVNLDISKTGTGTGTVTAAGIDCGADCSEMYGENTVVTLTALASTDSIFGSWSGDCSGSLSPTDVTMDADKTCIATFTKKVPDLTGSWMVIYSLSRGTNISGMVRTWNTGNGNAGSYKVAFYLSTNGITLGNLLKTYTVSGLNAGTSKNISFSYTSNISLSGKYLIAVIDSGNQVSETNESNNSAKIKIP